MFAQASIQSKSHPKSVGTAVRSVFDGFVPQNAAVSIDLIATVKTSFVLLCFLLVLFFLMKEKYEKSCP